MEYYLYQNKEKQGPLSLEEVKRKNLTPNTLVWHTGLSNWVEARTIPELNDFFQNMPPEPPVTEETSETPPPPPMPKTWLVESILVTLFCCLPFGIAGIIYAAQVEGAYYAGDYKKAYSFSKQAKTWTLWGFASIGICIILYLCMIAGVFCLPFLLT